MCKLVLVKSRTSYFQRLITVIEENQHSIEQGVELLVSEILSAGEKGNSVWLVGNGGSASTAEHFETDLAFIRHKVRLPSVSALTSNSALMTAAANDTSYEDAFSVILQKKARQGDLLVLISASGNSKNILNAISYAKGNDILTISILGFDGGLARDLSDYSVVVRTAIGEYGITEDVHLSICHAASLSILRRLSN